MLEPGHTPDEKGEVTCPDLTGGTNFWPPSYDPRTNLFFVNARERAQPLMRTSPSTSPANGSRAAPQQLVNNRDEKPLVRSGRSIRPRATRSGSS